MPVKKSTVKSLAEQVDMFKTEVPGFTLHKKNKHATVPGSLLSLTAIVVCLFFVLTKLVLFI